MAFKQTPRYYKGLYAPLNSSIIIIKQLFSAFTNELRVLTIIFSFVFLQNCTKYLVSCKAAMCAFLLEAWCCDCFQRTTKYWGDQDFQTFSSFSCGLFLLEKHVSWYTCYIS